MGLGRFAPQSHPHLLPLCRSELGSAALPGSPFPPVFHQFLNIVMNETQIAFALQETGLRHFRDGMYPEAMEAFTGARVAFLEAGDGLHAAEVLNNIGIIHRVERRKEEAITALTDAWRILEEHGDRSRAAQTLANLGGVYAAVRERDEAARHYRQAIEIFAELGDDNRRGETLMALGGVQMKQGHWGEALATHHAGLSALERPSLAQRLLLRLLDIALRLMNR